MALIWIKGGTSVEIFKKFLDFFVMNQIGISPQIIKKHADSGDLVYLMDKLQPHISDFYINVPLQEVNYMTKLLETVAKFAGKEYVQLGMQHYIQLIALLG